MPLTRMLWICPVDTFPAAFNFLSMWYYLYYITRHSPYSWCVITSRVRIFNLEFLSSLHHITGNWILRLTRSLLSIFVLQNHFLWLHMDHGSSRRRMFGLARVCDQQLNKFKRLGLISGLDHRSNDNIARLSFIRTYVINSMT